MCAVRHAVANGCLILDQRCVIERSKCAVAVPIVARTTRFDDSIGRTQLLLVSLPRRTEARLAALAMRTERSIPSLVCEAIERFLDNCDDTHLVQAAHTTKFGLPR
jgi:predicted DNA-binding protein